MSTAVLVQDIDLYTALSFQSVQPGPLSLAKGSCRLTTPGRDICLLAAPSNLKGQLSMAALADVLVCKAPLEQLLGDVEAKRQFTEVLVRNYVMGLRFVVVCVDDPSPSDVVLTQEHFGEISTELNQLFRRVGYTSRAYIVPTSIQRFTNIREKTGDFSWYSGPSLLGTLSAIDLPRRTPGTFMFLVRDCFQKEGKVVCCGRVVRGQVSVGETVVVNPGVTTSTVGSLMNFGQVVETVRTGDVCGLGLMEINRHDVWRGSVLSSPSQPCFEVVSFEAQLISMNKYLKWGWEPTMYTHCGLVPVRVEKIIKQIEKQSGALIAEMPEMIKPGEACLVQITPKRPISLCIFTQLPFLGRLILSSSNKCEMVGVVRSLTDIRSSKW